MAFFTVTFVFEDRTFAVEQVESDTPERALAVACGQAGALAGYDAQAITEMLQYHLKMFQVAACRGVWNWFQVPNEARATADIFGGIIVQSDPHAPIRN